MGKNKRKTSKEERFASKYYTPKSVGSYVGKSAFQNTLPRRDREAAADWLDTQQPYLLHKPVIRKFKRRKTIAGLEEQLQIDLIDVSAYSKFNDGIKFLLTCIDVFSKKAEIAVLLRKDAKSVSEAFERVLQKLKFKPLYVHSDQGTEFLNATFRKLLKRRGIKAFSTKDATIKCGIVERFNRTIMQKIYRYFEFKNSRRYADVLSDIVRSYNSTKHSSTGFAPSNITHQNKEKVWLKLFNRPTTKSKSDLSIGTYVRIPKEKRAFAKGYAGGWTREVFRIKIIHRTAPRTFSLEDLAGEAIEGAFYEKELAKTPLPEFYDIERVLDRRGDQFLVKYRGYPAKFNEWVDNKSIKSI